MTSTFIYSKATTAAFKSIDEPRFAMAVSK